jgi:hypothetical protein
MRTQPEAREQEFLRQVEGAFSALIHRGDLTVISSEYYANAFGNEQVELAGRKIHLRIMRDRGDVYACVARSKKTAEARGWVGLLRLLQAVGVRFRVPQSVLSPATVAGFVERHFAEIEYSLSTERIQNTMARVEELAAKWLRRERLDTEKIRRRQPYKTTDDYQAEARERLARTPASIKQMLGIEDKD